jgi:hypothetical protein
MIPFLRKTKNTNMAGCWYLKVMFCFMTTTHEPLHLDKRSSVKWKIMDIFTSFIWIIIFSNGLFEYGYGGIFKLLRWMQNLHQSTWDHKILYADIFRGWTTFNKNTLQESKYLNMAGGWKSLFFPNHPWPSFPLLSLRIPISGLVFYGCGTFSKSMSNPLPFCTLNIVPDRPLVWDPIKTLLEYPYELGVWDFDPIHILILIEVWC